MTKQTMGLFFGAGAEMSYGLPSGGRFALDIFKMDKTEDKEQFKKRLEMISPSSQIARQWLPDKFATRNIYVFGRGNFEAIMTSSLENRKELILDYLEAFDDKIRWLLTQNMSLSEEALNEKFEAAYGQSLHDLSYADDIQLNEKLTKESLIFSSTFFSAFLFILEKKPTPDIRKIVLGIMELLVSSLGENLVNDLNSQLLKTSKTSLNVFDDLGSLFSLNYASFGNAGLEVVLGDSRTELGADATIEELFVELGSLLLEDAYGQVLDYQGLIDSHFRYLFQPKAHWAKFTRMAVFLYSVQRYMENVMSQQKDHEGYYHDLSQLATHYDISTIGTSNYTPLLKEIVPPLCPEKQIFHLNGYLTSHYDPYRNRIYEDDLTIQKELQLTVPFLFTQSGVKPLTDVAMSEQYVEYYRQLKAVDHIAILGYGFNGDDGHINGMFRRLVDEDDKKLHIFHYLSDTSQGGDTREIKQDYVNRLRLMNESAACDNLRIHLVDNQRQADEKPWTEVLKNNH